MTFNIWCIFSGCILNKIFVYKICKCFQFLFTFNTASNLELGLNYIMQYCIGMRSTFLHELYGVCLKRLWSQVSSSWGACYNIQHSFCSHHSPLACPVSMVITSGIIRHSGKGPNPILALILNRKWIISVGECKQPVVCELLMRVPMQQDDCYRTTYFHLEIIRCLSTSWWFIVLLMKTPLCLQFILF